MRRANKIFLEINADQEIGDNQIQHTIQNISLISNIGSLMLYLEPQWVFQHDNDRKHTAPFVPD